MAASGQLLPHQGGLLHRRRVLRKLDKELQCCARCARRRRAPDAAGPRVALRGAAEGVDRIDELAACRRDRRLTLIPTARSTPTWRGLAGLPLIRLPSDHRDSPIPWRRPEWAHLASERAARPGVARSSARSCRAKLEAAVGRLNEARRIKAAQRGIKGAQGAAEAPAGQRPRRLKVFEAELKVAREAQVLLSRCGFAGC